VVRPHGIRGEVAVEVRTDDPDERFAAGSVLGTDPPAAGPLTVVSTRWHSGRLLVSFAGIADRNQAEPLRGIWLTVDATQITAPEDPDEFHDHQLVGLTVVTRLLVPATMFANPEYALYFPMIRLWDAALVTLPAVGCSS